MTLRPAVAGRRRSLVRAAAPAAFLWAVVWLAWPGALGPGARALAAPVDPDAFTQAEPTAPELALRASLQATRAELNLTGRRLLRGSDEIYLSSASAASLFQARRDWQEELRRLTLRAGGRVFQLTAGSRLVVRDDGEVLLRAPVLADAGDLWVPLEFLTRVVGPAVRESVQWDPQQRLLTVGSARANVTGLRVEELTRATVLHFLCTEPLTYRVEGAEPGWVVLKIYGGLVDPGQVALSGPRGLVEGLEARQFDTDARIHVRVSDLVTSYRSYTGEDKREIVLTLEEEQLGLLPEPAMRGRLELAVREPEPAVTRVLDVRTVIIDPGHGGEETGRIGPRGTLEKNVNLDVARELKRYLERRGDVKVFLTREGDEALPLVRRAEIANQADGDLFISLHCNGWFSAQATGVETYFLSPAKTDRDASVAIEENRDLSAPNEDVSFILWDLVQNGFINESSDLAETIQGALCQALAAENRGVKQAGFRVLVGAYMPAVLVEMGFLSNADEEKRLGDAAHQQLVARTIGQAVLDFRERWASAAAAAAAAGDGDDEEERP